MQFNFMTSMKMNMDYMKTQKKKGKGVPKSIVKNELHYDDFKHCLNIGDVK